MNELNGEGPSKANRPLSYAAVKAGGVKSKQHEGAIIAHCCKAHKEIQQGELFTCQLPD